MAEEPQLANWTRERVSAMNRLAFARAQNRELLQAEADARIDLAAAIMAMDETENQPGRHNLVEQQAVNTALIAYGDALADLIRGDRSAEAQPSDAVAPGPAVEHRDPKSEDWFDRGASRIIAERHGSDPTAPEPTPSAILCGGTPSTSDQDAVRAFAEALSQPTEHCRYLATLRLEDTDPARAVIRDHDQKCCRLCGTHNMPHKGCILR